MQAICLHFCFESNIGDTLAEHIRIAAPKATIEKVLERTSTATDFSTLLGRIARRTETTRH